MSLKSCREAEEAKEEAFLSVLGRKPASGDMGPPVSTPAGLKHTKPSSTQAVSSVNMHRLDPESLDPGTLRLLWGQRELEIQALRYAIQNNPKARDCHILQKVAGFPPERSPRSQEKLLQTQVQKLTLELQEQKERAQLEKVHLEKQLLQTRTLLQQLDAQVEALQKSCLLKLAQSSWVGRMLRSSTGSVEVVTAEDLMDPSDENDEVPPAREGFRLEDVDWNAVARRYPNLFADIKSNSDYKTGFCLKIVAVSLREKFVRILNESMEETADLGGFTLQLLQRNLPVFVYRFPPHTLLAPRHHVTVHPAPRPALAPVARARRRPQVWSKGPGSTKKQPPSSVAREPVQFHSSRSLVTLLLSPKGEVVSEHQAPHCVTPISSIFDDNINLSIDTFPLSEAQPGADTREQLRQPRPPSNGRVRVAPARSRRQGTRALLPRLSRLSPLKLSRPREVPAPPESMETIVRELLPAIPQGRLGLADGQARKEQRIRVCRKRVDRGCPMVALSLQSMAERRFGFRFLRGPPITWDPRGRV